MTTYDWGERQERADYLIKLLNKEPDKIAKFPLDNREYTQGEVADHIDRGTVVGREIVSIAGLVLYALDNDPDLKIA